MKPHLLCNTTGIPKPAQSLISLVSFDPNTRTITIDASIAENLCGINVDKFLNNDVKQSPSPHQIQSVPICTKEADPVPMKSVSDKRTEQAEQRRKDTLSAAEREFSALGRKAARLLRKKKIEGYKAYAAQQEVARIIEKPWTQIQYAVQLHNNKLNPRYEGLRNCMIFELWADKGMAKKEIAERFKVHPKTISSWIADKQSKKGNV